MAGLKLFLRRIFGPFLRPTAEQEIVRQLERASRAPRTHYLLMDGIRCGVLRASMEAPKVVLSGRTSAHWQWQEGDYLVLQAGAGDYVDGEQVKDIVSLLRLALPSEKPANDELPLQCEAVDGVLDMRVGQKILAFATENCPHLWDAERDRGRYRITDPKVFAEAVARELNHEDEAGSTPLSRLLDEAIEDAIGQGAEGVEEVE